MKKILFLLFLILMNSNTQARVFTGGSDYTLHLPDQKEYIVSNTDDLVYEIQVTSTNPSHTPKDIGFGWFYLNDNSLDCLTTTTPNFEFAEIFHFVYNWQLNTIYSIDVIKEIDLDFVDTSKMYDDASYCIGLSIVVSFVGTYFFLIVNDVRIIVNYGDNVENAYSTATEVIIPDDVVSVVSEVTNNEEVSYSLDFLPFGYTFSFVLILLPVLRKTRR